MAFLPTSDQPANVQVELSVALNQHKLDALGEDFEKTSKGFIDFLLLDSKGSPLIVLEAKSEEIDPLVGKEQARKYARSLVGSSCSPTGICITSGTWSGATPISSLHSRRRSRSLATPSTPDSKRLVAENVQTDYIVLSQRPSYASEAAWKYEAERPAFIQSNKLRFLRDYQLKAVHALQQSVKDGNDRFLFEMATGTGKTLTAAAIIKLFLRSGNVSRVLFLVDRLELEEQARKVFTALLSADYQTVIYKENRDAWRSAEIVVTTVQSLLFNNKYQTLFSPTDFDLVISDEAHRSISGNARVLLCGLQAGSYCNAP